MPLFARRNKRPRTTMDLIMFAIFTLMFGGLGVMLLVVGTREHFLQKRLLANASVVEAEILSARVIESKSSDTDRRTLRDNSTTSYLPEVRFAYTLGGVRYESDTIYPTIIHQGQASADSAREEIAEYKVGGKVKAYVDAANPERGFLRPTRSIGPVAFLIGGVLSFGFLFLFYRFG